MGYESAHGGYKVRVDGMTLGDTRFVIQAAVDYDVRLSEGERQRLTPEAQTELMLAIAGAWERGHRLGARDVRVAVIVDSQLERTFRAASGESAADGEKPSPRGVPARRVDATVTPA